MATLYNIFTEKWEPMITRCRDKHTFSPLQTVAQVHENLPEGKTSNSMSCDMSDYSTIIWILLFHTTWFETVGIQDCWLRLEFTPSRGKNHVHMVVLAVTSSWNMIVSTASEVLPTRLLLIHGMNIGSSTFHTCFLRVFLQINFFSFGMNIRCILQIETNSYLSYITDYFVIKEQVELLLDELLPGLSTLPTSQQHEYKIREHFHETPPFDSPLPFIAMFFLRPPYSNLLMSPKINHRQVACDTFATVPTGKSSSLRDSLYQQWRCQDNFSVKAVHIVSIQDCQKHPGRNRGAILVFLEGTTEEQSLTQHNYCFEKCMCLQYCKWGFQLAYGFVWKACGRKIQCLQFCRPS